MLAQSLLSTPRRRGSLHTPHPPHQCAGHTGLSSCAAPRGGRWCPTCPQEGALALGVGAEPAAWQRPCTPVGAWAGEGAAPRAGEAEAPAGREPGRKAGRLQRVDFFPSARGLGRSSEGSGTRNAPAVPVLVPVLGQRRHHQGNHCSPHRPLSVILMCLLSYI